MTAAAVQGEVTRRDLRRYLVVAVPLAVLGTVLFGLLTTPIDLTVYRAGAREVLRGGADLYRVSGRAGYQFTYPPFAALLMAPLAWLSYAVGVYVMAAASFAALIRTVWLLSALVDRTWTRLRPGALRGRAGAGIGLLVAMLATEPVYVTFALAQVNLFLLWLVVEDLAGPHRRLRGALTGIAVGIKLTPGIFLLYLLLTRQWRAAATCAATALVTVLLAAAVLPEATWDFWTRALTDPGRVGPREFTANQSLNGLVWRATGPGGNDAVWAVLVLATLILGAFAVRRAHRLAPWTALPMAALVGLLVSPISWDHHWVWGVPAAVAVLVLAGRVRAARGAAWVAGALMFVMVTWTIWWMPFRYGREWGTPWVLRLGYSAYVLAGLALLAWVAFADRRAEPAVSDAVGSPVTAADEDPRSPA